MASSDERRNHLHRQPHFIFFHFVFFVVNLFAYNKNLSQSSTNQGKSDSHENHHQQSNTKTTKTWFRAQTQAWSDHIQGLRQSTATTGARSSQYKFDKGTERYTQKTKALAQEQNVRFEKSREQALENRSIRADGARPTEAVRDTRARKPGPAAVRVFRCKQKPND